MRKNGSEQEILVLQKIGRVLLGALCAFGVSLLCLPVFALCVSEGWLPENWSQSLILAACLFGSGAGGWYAAKGCTGGCLLKGMTVGGGLFLMLVSAGALSGQGVSVEHGGGFLLASCLCGGALAGLLRSVRRPKGLRMSKKRKKR